MRRSMAAALILTVLLFGGAYLTTGGSAAQEPESGDDTAQEPSGQGRRDSTVLLTVQDGDTAEEMALDAYLRGVVRGEMPASFETEALRAQAAAERTYVYHQLAAGRKEAHPDADVCTDPGCCSAWLSEEAAQEKWGDDFTAWEERIEDAVAATDGQVALYRGEPILAVFHSSSAGRTAEALETCGAAMCRISGAWTAPRGRRRCPTITARCPSRRQRQRPCWRRPIRS